MKPLSGMATLRIGLQLFSFLVSPHASQTLNPCVRPYCRHGDVDLQEPIQSAAVSHRECVHGRRLLVCAGNADSSTKSLAYRNLISKPLPSKRTVSACDNILSSTRAMMFAASAFVALPSLSSGMQGALKSSNQAWNVLTPRPGGNNLAYAWDEPTLEHKLLVHVRMLCPIDVSHLQDAVPAKPWGVLRLAQWREWLIVFACTQAHHR